MDLLTLYSTYSTYSSFPSYSSAFVGNILAAFWGLIIFIMIFALISIVLLYASYWSILKKAGKEGIDGLIPVHNEICLLEICGIPKAMWFINLIPFGVIVFLIILGIYMARSYGKSGGFAVGLILLPLIFYPMLAWGNARYVGKSWGISYQPQYQAPYQPPYQPQQNYQQPAQPVNPQGTFQQYQAPQPQQPQNPGNVPPQQ